MIMGTDDLIDGLTKELENQQKKYISGRDKTFNELESLKENFDKLALEITRLENELADWNYKVMTITKTVRLLRGEEGW